MIRVAFLTTDSREHFRDYERVTPFFGSAPEALLEGFAALNDIEVHVICCLQMKMPSPDRLQPNIYYHGLYVPKLGWMRTAYQGCVRAVRRRLDQIQPDLVHGQGTERDCGISAALSGRPNLVTVHGHMRRIAELVRAKPFTFYWLMSRIENYVLKRTMGVICISRYTQSAVQSMSRRTWLIPNAIGNQFFSADLSITPKESSDKVILCVGHVNPWKNQNWLIHTLEPLRAKIPFRIRFLGRVFEHWEYCQEFLRLIETRPWCQHLGQIEREVVRDELNKATLLVLPSLEENCPMVVLEAMAAGVPVVAADVGGVSDLVQNNKTGLLVRSQDEAGFRSAVEKLLENPTLAEQLRRNAHEEARRRFLPEVVARQHVEVYRGLLER